MRLQKSRLCVLHCRPKAVRACADFARLSWCSGNIQLKGAAPDLSAATYQIHDESHTIGNALRWMLMKKYVPYATLQCAAIIDTAGSIVCEARRWNSADTGTYSLLPSVYPPFDIYAKRISSPHSVRLTFFVQLVASLRLLHGPEQSWGLPSRLFVRACWCSARASHYCPILAPTLHYPIMTCSPLDFHHFFPLFFALEVLADGH